MASSGDGPPVHLHRPLIGEAAAAGEIHDRSAKLLIARPSVHCLFVFARVCRIAEVEGEAPASAAKVSSGGDRSRQSPISARRLLHGSSVETVGN